jgi:uncharacterized protein DUF6491
MNIRNLFVCIGFAAATAAGVGVAEAASAPVRDASIPFANHGGIRDWTADRDQGLWVQDSRRNWYYAKLLGPCIGLDFAWSIGFDTRPMGTFDRFSSIVVPRQGRCMIQSLAPSEGPPVKHKSDKATAPEATGSAS